MSLQWAILGCVCKLESSFSPCGSLSVSKRRVVWVVLYVTWTSVMTWLREQSVQVSTYSLVALEKRSDFSRQVTKAQWIKSSYYAYTELGTTRGCFISLVQEGTSRNCRTAQGRKSSSAQNSEEKQLPFLHLFLCVSVYTQRHFIIEKSLRISVLSNMLNLSCLPGAKHAILRRAR